MPFVTDKELATEVADHFGQYVATFVSANQEVRADLFEREDTLEAHLTFPTGLDPDEVTDTYLSELHKFTTERGYRNRIRMIVSASR